MKVLVIGAGGREHALVWKLSQSPRVDEILCAPGNGGTAGLARNVAVADTDLEGLLDLAKKEGVGLTIVGPEAPLASGIVDRFEAQGLRIFGPSAAAARIEADKAFSKEIMRSQAIPTAEARIFTSYKDAKNYLATRDTGVVVKASGLAKGKGVTVCDDPAHALRQVEKVMVDRIFGEAGSTVVIEEKLVGQEASILAFVGGNSAYVLESAQDHKPIGENDTGPNTGGMGAYSPTPIVTDKVYDQVQREVIVPLLEGLRRNDTSYCGILYVGIMLTAAGPKVLEFNCRFGDPEAQPILMRLKTDLVDVIESALDGKLDTITLDWDPRPAVCVVLASGGYPDTYEKGKVIHGLEDAGAIEDVMVFHAGTVREGKKVLTSGGRVLGVTALGKNLDAAQRLAYEAVDKISFEGAYFRRDIAAKAL